MPAAALAFALGAAFLHALWNLLVARETDTEAATAVGLLSAVAVLVLPAALTYSRAIGGRRLIVALKPTTAALGVAAGAA